MKERLDVLLVQQGLARSREQAKALIMAGEVLVNGQREDKAGTQIDSTSALTVKGSKLRYVSRGGLKLEKAMQTFFGVSPADKICLDAGASTGGFTDCMLQNGAKKVYAVDVGYGQLDWGLRSDPRVVCMEKTNVRYIHPEDFKEPPSFTTIDVSFISLKKVLDPIRQVMTKTGDIICLIKPQFEAGREKVGKKGVVKDPLVHEEVIQNVITYAQGIDLSSKALTFSPVKGPEGNIEYLLHLKKSEGANETVDFDRIARTVSKAHQALNKTPKAGEKP